MANTNEYIDEAYSTLLKLSADDKKRLEYESREKAIRDYNSQMHSAERSGIKQGIAIGEERGEAKQIIEMGQDFGLSDNDILERLQAKLHLPLNNAKEYLEKFGK